MNTSSSSAGFFYRIVLSFTLGLGCFCVGKAQGFFTATDHASGAGQVRFEILPEGEYRAKATYATLSGGYTFNYGILHLNGEGQEAGWDSLAWHPDTTVFGYNWLPDNDFLKINYGPNGFWTVRKLNWNNEPLWVHAYPSSLARQLVVQVRQNAAGEIFLMNSDYNLLENGGANKLALIKLGADGNLLWKNERPLPDSSAVAVETVPTNDGGCIYSLSSHVGSNYAFRLTKIGADGQLQWSVDPAVFTPYVLENAQGEIYTLSSNQYQQQQVTKYAPDGQVLWTQNLNTIFQKYSVRVGLSVLSESGNLLAGGADWELGGSYQHYFACFDPDGQLLWKKRYALLGENSVNMIGGAKTPDDGFIVGVLHPLSSTLAILKMNAQGEVYPGAVGGRITLDPNLDCLPEPGEQALAHWKVRLAKPDLTLYATTDSSGHYALPDVPDGDYQLSALTPSPLWESCAGSVPVILADSSVITRDFPIQIVADCPFMTVDIGTSLLRPCHSSTYYVQYCNQGTVVADSAYVLIMLDTLMHLNSASIPYAEAGDTLIFYLGPVGSLACGDFAFNVSVDCDAALGRTLCVGARIFPDTLCYPPAGWSGALLEGSGYCDGDSVRFQLHNVGIAPTSNGLDFIIADDHVIMLQQPLSPLPPDGKHEVTMPANGATWRLLADQEPNAPGMEMPSVGVEGCGTGLPAWGLLLQFPNRDGNPFTDRDCHEVVGSFDPNDKQAFPIGFDSQHFIEQNTPLDYQIRFQNTGTDTAFLVVVKDTLSPWLDPGTVRPGAASHPYTWNLSGTGVLTFTFKNILLPDSNVNEAASHGFVQFGIQQRPDNPPGTLLENRAGIYFDANEPVITNTVWHTVGRHFLTSAVREPGTTMSALRIWPNPARQATTVWSEKPLDDGRSLVLRDALGRVVRVANVQGQKTELLRAGLPPGLYFVELRNAHTLLAVGKVIWE